MTACGGKSGTDQVETSGEMSPLIDQEGADPWVTCQDGKYYYTKTTGNTITIFRSDNLSDVASGERADIWQEDGDIESFWAPEIHRIDGVWYVYFAACTYDSDIHTMYVLSNESDDPFGGEWTCSPMKGMDDKFAIDGTVLDTGKDRYFIWSGWEGYENVCQNLYIARMVSPTETEKEKVLISIPEYDWEMNGNPLVNEGPQPVIQGDTVNLIYSASGSWTNEYCLGLLTAGTEDDLCDPSVWTKEDEPVFKSANDVYGPGHNSFVLSPDGKEMYMVYHAARWDGAGWSRSVRMQPVEFDENGVFVSCEPVRSSDVIPVPGGEPEKMRSIQKEMKLSDGIAIEDDSEALSGCAIKGFDDSSENAEWTVDIPESGMYSISVFSRVENISGEEDFAYSYITVNGEESEVQVYPSVYYQPVTFRTQLKEGENLISVSFEAMGGSVNLDRIELTPVN